MVRPRKKRRVCFSPIATYFKPAGIPLKGLETVSLAFDELEALRLQDLLEYDQKSAANEMSISQSTFHRLVCGARKKIVEALIEGKAIKIEGGNYLMEKQIDTKNGVVAISSSSNNLEGDIDDRFGRCSYFVLVTLENGNPTAVTAVKNEQAHMSGGAGVAVAQMITQHKVIGVITGNVGPRALDVLSQFQIPVFHGEGSKNQALQLFIKNELKQI